MNNIFKQTLLSLLPYYTEREASAIVRYVMEMRFGYTRLDFCVGKDIQLSEQECKELENIVSRLQRHEPVQYVLGKSEFCGITINVAPGVLIPRPETEELVEWISQDESLSACDALLDVGTGSGCIAIALAMRFKDSHVYAFDISDEALRQAGENALQNGVKVSFNKVNILDKDANEAVVASLPKFKVIVSNPPYICERESQEMEPNVLDYEPHTALFVPDDDPLLFYRALSEYAWDNLCPGGRLYVEINRSYGKETMSLFEQKGFVNVELRKDFAGNDRMIRCER